MTAPVTCCTTVIDEPFRPNSAPHCAPAGTIMSLRSHPSSIRLKAWAMREAFCPAPGARSSSIRASGRHGTVAAGPCPPAAGVFAPSTAGAGGVSCEKRQECPFRQRP